MAGFRMHVGTSTVLGCGYAGVLALGYGVKEDTAIVAGAMCAFGGMLPDLDSDYGVPLRETMAFTAAIIPIFMVKRFEALHLSHDSMALAAVGTYLFVRFGVTRLIRKFTVHRGMFHSIPAMLIFGGIAFLICGGSPFAVRCMKAGGLMAGCLSHLLLDEIYAVEFKSGRWRMKKSFGTAMKLWGDSRGSNFVTYSKLAVVAMSIIGEPSVMQGIADINPQFAEQMNGLRTQFATINPSGSPQNGSDVARAAIQMFNNATSGRNQSVAPNGANGWPQPQYAGSPPQPYGNAPPPPNNQPPTQWQWPAASQGQPPNYGNSFDTAQRPNVPFSQ
jgi:hypothetical protein